MYEDRALRVLLIEDDNADAELVREALSEARNIRISLTHSDRVSHGLVRLSEEKFDVILSDLELPDSRGIETFTKIREAVPDIPVILLTGLGDDVIAVEAVRQGAQDYLVKGHFESDLLIRSIQYAIERKKLMMQLEKSLKEIRTLQGLIPICAWCKKIRDDSGFWKSVEAYIEEHTGAAFTHGMCQDCGDKALAELLEMRKKKGVPGKGTV